MDCWVFLWFSIGRFGLSMDIPFSLDSRWFVGLSFDFRWVALDFPWTSRLQLILDGLLGFGLMFVGFSLGFRCVCVGFS